MRKIALALLLAAFLTASCGGGSGGESAEKTGKKKGGPKADKTEKPDKPAPPAAPDVDVQKAAKGLSSGSPLERDAAIRETACAGPEATKKMLELLASGSDSEKTAAMTVLSMTGDKAAKDAVEKALAEARSAEESLYALLALGGVGDSSSIPKMKEFLSYNAPPRFPAEAGWMVEKGRETEEGFVRNQAAESLALLGEYSGVPVIIENLNGNGWVRKDSLIRLRRMTGCKVDHGYHMGDSRDDRAAAVGRWKKWWKEKGASFKPEWTGDPAIYDVDMRGK